MGSISPPLDPRGVALEPVGYVEEEWFASGDAADYIAVKDFTEDGMWRGAEMKKTRPAVIVSLDALNRVLDTVTVCPLTTQLRPRWRSRVQVRCAGRAADVAVDQIRTVSKARLGERIGTLSKHEAATLRRVITEMYGE